MEVSAAVLQVGEAQAAAGDAPLHLDFLRHRNAKKISAAAGERIRFPNVVYKGHGDGS